MSVFSRYMLNIWEGIVKLFVICSPISSDKTLTQMHPGSHWGYVLMHSAVVVSIVNQKCISNLRLEHQIVCPTLRTLRTFMQTNS